MAIDVLQCDILPHKLLLPVRLWPITPHPYDEWQLRLPTEGLRATAGQQATATEDRYPVDVLLDARQDMGGDQHAGAALAQLAEDVIKLTGGGRVETGGGLIQQQQPRLAQQGLRQPQALAHAFGVGFDPAVGGLLQPDPLEQRSLGSGTDTLEFAEVGQHFAAAQLLVETDVLRQVTHASAQVVGLGTNWRGAEQPHLPLAGTNHPQHQFHGGGLTGAIVTQQAHDLPRGQIQGDVGQGGHLAKVLADLLQFQYRAHVGLSPITGVINGALSRTPWGRSTGNRSCTQRRVCTAGLFISTRAMGYFHSSLSTASLGSYPLSPIPSALRSQPR